MSNNQLTEIKGSEYVIGTGYRVKDLFRFRSEQRKKDFFRPRFKIRFNIRNNETIIRKIVENDDKQQWGIKQLVLNYRLCCKF